MFNPSPHEMITLDGEDYIVEPNPLVPGLAYEQEGSKAIVYRVRSKNNKRFALKVFKHLFRDKDVLQDCQRIAPFHKLPGLKAASRAVVLPTDPAAQRQPDLHYAVLMPWIDGNTWFDVLASQTPLIPHVALGCARRLLYILARMEQENAVHTDIASGNVLIEVRIEDTLIELIDLEDMWVKGNGSKHTTHGTGSYSFPHLTADNSTSCPEGDRYSGAMMAAEMLAMCHPDLASHARGEGLVGQGVDMADLRFHLGRFTPDFLPLFDCALNAKSLPECPSLKDLAASLGKADLARATQHLSPTPVRPTTPTQFNVSPGVISTSIPTTSDTIHTIVTPPTNANSGPVISSLPVQTSTTSYRKLWRTGIVALLLVMVTSGIVMQSIKFIDNARESSLSKSRSNISQEIKNIETEIQNLYNQKKKAESDSVSHLIDKSEWESILINQKIVLNNLLLRSRALSRENPDNPDAKALEIELINYINPNEAYKEIDKALQKFPKNINLTALKNELEEMKKKNR